MSTDFKLYSPTVAMTPCACMPLTKGTTSCAPRSRVVTPGCQISHMEHTSCHKLNIYRLS
jgi:hypothetical protein